MNIAVVKNNNNVSNNVLLVIIRLTMLSMSVSI